MRIIVTIDDKLPDTNIDIIQSIQYSGLKSFAIKLQVKYSDIMIILNICKCFMIKILEIVEFEVQKENHLYCLLLSHLLESV